MKCPSCKAPDKRLIRSTVDIPEFYREYYVDLCYSCMEEWIKQFENYFKKIREKK
jgi:hypothetical protein